MLATRKFLLLTYEYDFTLQANAFIASDESLRVTSKYDITLQTNVYR